MKHQAIDRNLALPIEKGLNKKRIDLHGRVMRRDMLSIMSAMTVGDMLYITNDQTARNAEYIVWGFDIHHGKGFKVEEYLKCYWTVERTL